MAGTVEQALLRVGKLDNVQKLTFSCTGDSSDGSIPDSATSSIYTDEIVGWYLDQVIVDPGATAPTADSDVVINDEWGFDLLGGNGSNLLHSSTTKTTIPATDGQNKRQPVLGALTLSVTNQSVNSATYDVILVLVR